MHCSFITNRNTTVVVSTILHNGRPPGTLACIWRGWGCWRFGRIGVAIHVYTLRCSNVCEGIIAKHTGIQMPDQPLPLAKLCAAILYFYTKASVDKTLNRLTDNLSRSSNTRTTIFSFLLALTGQNLTANRHLCFYASKMSLNWGRAAAAPEGPGQVRIPHTADICALCPA